MYAIHFSSIICSKYRYRNHKKWCNDEIREIGTQNLFTAEAKIYESGGSEENYILKS